MKTQPMARLQLRGPLGQRKAPLSLVGWDRHALQGLREEQGGYCRGQPSRPAGLSRPAPGGYPEPQHPQVAEWGPAGPQGGSGEWEDT